jgi:hypothetical protein
MKIEPLYVYARRDSINHEQLNNFIVSHFCYCGADIRVFDSIACSLIKVDNFDYGIYFMRKSKKTNIKSKNEYHKILDQYSFEYDLLVKYEKNWDGGNIIKRYDIYKNREYLVSKVLIKEGETFRYQDLQK